MRRRAAVQSDAVHEKRRVVGRVRRRRRKTAAAARGQRRRRPFRGGKCDVVVFRAGLGAQPVPDHGHQIAEAHLQRGEVAAAVDTHSLVHYVVQSDHLFVAQHGQAAEICSRGTAAVARRFRHRCCGSGDGGWTLAAVICTVSAAAAAARRQHGGGPHVIQIFRHL